MLPLALAAAAYPQTPADGLAAGIASYESHKYADAVRLLRAAQPKLPRLADYTAYYLASALVEMKDAAGALKELEPLRGFVPASPLAGKALLVESRALVELDRAAEAAKLLRDRYAELPQPLGDLALADAYRAAGDAQATGFYQNVYYSYPATEAATRAGTALAAESNPPPPPLLRLERPGKWLVAKEYFRARKEFAALAAELTGEERDIAAVRVGAVDYLRKLNAAAMKYLAGLDVQSPEANAERLYYLVELGRRLDDDALVARSLADLAAKYGQSKWRLRALLAAANRHLVNNEPDLYEPMYRACFTAFPSDAEAPNCHWKVAWSAYIRRRKDAPQLLREHLTHFPGSSNAGAALYFLGRQAESQRDFTSARAYYQKIADRFPGYYYGLLARERLAQASIVRAPAQPQGVQWLNDVAFPARRAPVNQEPSAATVRRIERAKFLYAGGLQALAEAELRFGAKSDGQPHLLAMEMARSAQTTHQGLRFMKSLVQDYLTMPLDTAPQQFWELLFPLPYRNELVKATGASGLDPFVVAGLIRQESEFDPKAVSRANARGLTQVKPPEGRFLARKAGLKQYSTPMLFQPAVNLRLGTMYLRSLLDQWGGKWEQTLASYNAGKSRVIKWLNFGDYSEPAEFIETIPFTETREYVQSVLRNAAIYRKLYGDQMAGTGTVLARNQQ
jgi:soluble lytic murein transglycosylase